MFAVEEVIFLWHLIKKKLGQITYVVKRLLIISGH